MFHCESLEELEAKLETIEAEIAAHPLAPKRVKAAHALVEMKGYKDTEAVSRELADQNLPSLEELGEIQARRAYSWWKLHRDQNKLAKKVEQLKH